MIPTKFSKYFFYLLLIICVITGGLYFFGGKVTTVTGTEVPVYTNLLLIVLCGMFGAAVTLTVLAVIGKLIERFRRSPKYAIRSVLGFFTLAFLMLLCWLLGSTNALPLQEYNGTYNTPCWLRLTDMFIYTTFALIGAAVFLIIGFYIGRKVR